MLESYKSHVYCNQNRRFTVLVSMLMKNMDQSTHLTILPVTKIKYYDKPNKKLRSKQEICCPKINENLDQTTHLPFHLLSIIMTNPPKQKTYSHKPNEKRESKREPIRPLFLWLEIKIMTILKPKGVKESSAHLLQCQTTKSWQIKNLSQQYIPNISNSFKSHVYCYQNWRFNVR